MYPGLQLAHTHAAHVDKTSSTASPCLRSCRHGWHACTGRIRYHVPHFCAIIISPKSPSILRHVCLMTLRWTFDFYTNLTLWFYLISIHRYFGVPDATFVSLALASKYIHEHHTFVRTQLFCVYILCANFHMKIQTQKSWCTLDSRFRISHIRNQYRCSSRIATAFQILGKSTTWYQ